MNVAEAGNCHAVKIVRCTFVGKASESAHSHHAQEGTLLWVSQACLTAIQASIFLFIFHCFLSISQWKLLLRALVWLRNGLIEHQEQYAPQKVNLNSYEDLPKKNKSLSETTPDLTLVLSFASFALRISWGPRAERVLLCSASAALRSSELAEEPASVRVFMLPKQTQITGVNGLPWLLFYLQTMEWVVFLN